MPFACPPITVAMVWVCTMQNKEILSIQREERKERKAQAEWHNTTNKHCELTPELDMCTIKNTTHIKAQRIRAYPSHLRHLFFWMSLFPLPLHQRRATCILGQPSIEYQFEGICPCILHTFSYGSERTRKCRHVYKIKSPEPVRAVFSG